MKKDTTEKRIKNILVVQLGGIGDLVLTVPALKAIRTELRSAYIGLLLISRSSELLKGCAYFDESFVLDTDDTKIRNLFNWRVLLKFFKLIRELRKRKFDIMVNLENISTWKGSLKMFFLFMLVKARYTLGRDTEGKGYFFDLKLLTFSKYFL